MHQAIERNVAQGSQQTQGEASCAGGDVWAARFEAARPLAEAQLTRMTTGMVSMVGDLQGIGQGAVRQLGAFPALPHIEQVAR